MPNPHKFTQIAKPQSAAYAAVAAATRLLPTEPQVKLLEVLFIDACYSTRVRRNDWLSNRLGRPVKYLDDMSRQEASRMIETLQEEIVSGSRPELQVAGGRTPCGDCDGTGKVCGHCGQPWSGCEAYGHRYDPVVCGGCDGKRFED